MRRIHRLLQPQLLPMPRLRNFIFMGLALSAFGASAYALQDKPEPQVRDIKVIEAGKRFSMRSEGEVKLQPDEKAPVVAGKDGKFRLSEKKEGKARRYEVEGDKQTYTVDGKEQPLDAEGEAWIRNSLKDVEKMRVDSKTMAIHVGEMNADAMKAHEMAIEAQKEARRVQVEVKEDGPHRKRIIVMRDGKVETENVVETPEVEVKQEGEGKQHIIVKKGGKVERDEVIVIPKVKILREGNHQRVIVEKDGKIVEDHEMELPGFDGMEFMKPKAWKMEGFGNGEHFKMLSPRNASEVAALRQQVEALQRQVEQLQRQLGQTPKATPKPSPAPKPTSTPAPTPKP